MTGSDSAVADFAQQVDRVEIQAQVRRVRGKPGVLAIHAMPRWEGAESLEVDGEQVTVLPCATTLAVRDGLTRRRSVPGRLVLLTDLSDEQLGDGIREHLVGRRVLNPDPWQALRDRFGATAQESFLLSGVAAARGALRQLAQGPRPPAALGGVLTRDLLFDTLLGAGWGLDGGAGMVDLLTWSGRADADRRFGEWSGQSHPDLREDVLSWLERRWGQPSAGILAAVRAGRPPSDLIPLGLVADVIQGPDDGTRGDREALIVLRTRLESASGTALTGAALEGWARAATLAADQLAADGSALTAVQRRADMLGAELRVGDLVVRSDYLPAALDARLREMTGAMAAVVTAWPDSPGGDLMDGVEAAWNRVAEHVTVAGRPEDLWPRDVLLAQSLLRLLRYLALDPPDLRTLDRAVQWYRTVGSWVDAAVNDAFTGSDRPDLADVAHQVVQRVRAGRAAQDRVAARLIADDATYRRADRALGSPLMIEDLLDSVVLPLTAVPEPRAGTPDAAGRTRGSVLLVVADGMCGVAANDLVTDLSRRHAMLWQQADLVERDRRRTAAVAAFPTVTDMSRTSLLAGRLTTGSHTEPAALASWLTRNSRGSRAQTLFRKADIEAVSAGHALPSDVRAAIDDVVHRPVVACVLNAIDDALDRSDPIGTRWTTGSLHPLDALLNAAGRVGRTVVLTSDHGHVVERREQDRQRGDAVSARWRPANADTPVADDEVLVEGDRVLTDNGRAVLAVDEQLRYTRLKAGYHGGAALAEVVVPIVVLVPGDLPAHLPLLPAGGVPTWWVGAQTLTRAVTEADPPAAPARSRPARDRDGPPTLFDGPDVPGSPAVPDRVGAVLRTEQFTTNHQRFAPQLSAEQVGALLRALVAAGGSLGRPQAGAALGMTDRRLAGSLAVIGQVLNIDGIVVLAQTATEVTLVEGLLYEQFGVAP